MALFDVADSDGKGSLRYWCPWKSSGLVIENEMVTIRRTVDVTDIHHFILFKFRGSPPLHYSSTHG